MKKLLILTGIFCVLNVNAQDYFITFTGTGASESISTVRVENLTSGTSLIVNGNDILHLTAILTGVNSIEDNKSPKIKIYPNPMIDFSTLEIFPPEAGDATISVYNMTGILMGQVRSFLENSTQGFRLSGLKSGFYLIIISGNSYQYSGKILSKSKAAGTMSISKINGNQTYNEDKLKMTTKGIQAIVEMEYSYGDRLKFTGTSGNYSTVITDIPESNKAITFNLLACTDGDNNNYPVVEIGNQIWMAENLRTSKYNDGIPILKVTEDTEWGNLGVFDSVRRYTLTGAYCWYNNDSAVYNKDYGKLYNFGTVMTGKLCPVNWHVPSITEWFTLDAPYKIDTGYPDQTKPRGLGLMETGTKHWNNPIGTNESGFTALPGGFRSDGYNDTVKFYSIGQSSTFYSSTGWNFPNVGLYQMIPFTVNFGHSPSSCMIGATSGLSIRCVKDEPLPQLASIDVLNISLNDAICGGNIPTSDITITNRGVCWGNSENPTVSGSHTEQGSGAGSFTSYIQGLTPGTKYYVRAYATNVNGGIGYGNQVSFTTLSGSFVFNPDLTYGIVSDIEGNVYRTIQIGTQQWMAENLRTTTYNDNTQIPLVNSSESWAALTSDAYCWYENDQKFKGTYGAMYNWFTINTNKLCLTGWHVPANAEWTTLTDYLTNNGYGYQQSGNHISKSMAAKSGWTTFETEGTIGYNQADNNTSGFTALPGGTRDYDGTFGGIGNYGSTGNYSGWWSATEYNASTAWSLSMYYNQMVLHSTDDFKKIGLAVRCLKDN